MSEAVLIDLVKKGYGADIQPGDTPIGSTKDGNKILAQLSQSNSWKVISVRFDPCFKKIGASDHLCQPEIRVVAQPVMLTNFVQTVPESGGILHPGGSTPYTAITTEDAALHLTYKLTREKGQEVKEQLAIFKIANERAGISTKDTALGIHPAFRLEANGQASTQMIERLRSAERMLRSFVDANSLVEAEFMATAGMNASERNQTRNAVWMFSRYKVDEKNQTVSRRPIGRGVSKSCSSGKCEKSSFQSVSMTTGFLETIENGSYPNFKNIVDSWRKLAVKNDFFPEGVFGGGTESLVDNRQEIAKIARELDDSEKLSIKQTDCISCHYSSSLRGITQELADRDSELIDLATQYSKSFAGLADGVQVGMPMNTYKWLRAASERVYPADGYNLHSFGYMHALPSVSQRTINDSIISACYLSKYEELLKTQKDVSGDSQASEEE